MLHLWARHRAQFLTETNPQNDSGNMSIQLWFSYLLGSFHFIEFACLSSFWCKLLQSVKTVTSISGAWKESSLHCVDAVAADKGDSWAYYAFESLVEVLMLCKLRIESGENQTSQHTNYNIACLSFKTRQLPKLQWMLYIYIEQIHGPKNKQIDKGIHRVSKL